MLILVHNGCTKATTSGHATWPDNFRQLPARIRQVIGDSIELHTQFDKITRSQTAITFTLSHDTNQLSWQLAGSGLVYHDPRSALSVD